MFTTIQGYFKTKKRLNTVLEHISRCPELDEYLEKLYLLTNVDDSSEAVINGLLFDPPYYVYENTLGFGDEEKYAAQYVTGYNDIPLHSQRKWSYQNVISDWEYIDSVSLPEELEIQAEDGGLCYWNNGPAFLRIWKEIKVDG